MKRHERRAPDAVGTVCRSGDSAEGRKRDGAIQRAAFGRKPLRPDRIANPGRRDLNPVGIRFQCRQARHHCRNQNQIISKLRRRICRPDGAGELGGAGGYKDFAPDGAFGRSAPVSAGPVAAGGWAEAVENILWRGFANVLRLGVATAAPRPRRSSSSAPPPARRWQPSPSMRVAGN